MATSLELERMTEFLTAKSTILFPFAHYFLLLLHLLYDYLELVLGLVDQFDRAVENYGPGNFLK